MRCSAKSMSVSDTMMLRYYELLTDLEPAEIASIKHHAVHPMEAKKRLAGLIVEEYHDGGAARAARQHFETRFQKREVPADVPVFRLADEMWVCELMKQLKFVPSTSEARRLIGQGAVRVDGEPITDPELPFRSRPQPPARSRQTAHRQDRALAAHHQSNAGNGRSGKFQTIFGSVRDRDEGASRVPLR